MESNKASNTNVDIKSSTTQNCSISGFLSANLSDQTSAYTATIIQPRWDFQTKLAKEWKSDSSTSLCTSCQKPFHLFRRKHHCRFCGEIYCSKCTCFRITWINAPHPVNTKYPHSRVYRSCELCFALFINLSQRTNDETKTVLPIDIDPKREKNNTGATLLNEDSYHPNSLSLSVPTPTISYCPICSRQFVSIRKEELDRELDHHVDECVKRSSQIGCVGDRYSSFEYHKQNEDMEREIECSICYEVFQDGQKIALLNCFCKYHENCISTWFLKGRGCPFHPKRQLEKYLQ